MGWRNGIMTTYPDGTLLRISPSSIGNSVAVSLGDSIAVNPSLAAPVESAAEWLAICMGEAAVGNGGVHTTYPSVEAWLATIPADMTQLQIHPAVKEKEQKQAKKATKKKVWNVPKARSTQKWAYHVYTMIRESGIDRDDVREAYNRFADRLAEYSTDVRTSAPWPRQKYQEGIELSDDINTPRYGIRDHVHIASHVSASRGSEILRAVHADYFALFALIQDTVVPYMKRMYKKRQDDYNTTIYTRALTKAVADHQRLVQNYQHQEAYLRSRMEKFRAKLDAIKESQSAEDSS